MYMSFYMILWSYSFKYVTNEDNHVSVTRKKENSACFLYLYDIHKKTTDKKTIKTFQESD